MCVYFSLALCCYLDIHNMSLITDVMEELGLGDVGDLEGTVILNFVKAFMVFSIRFFCKDLNIFVYFYLT